VAFIDTWGNAQLIAEPPDLEAALGGVEEDDQLRVEATDAMSLGGSGSIELAWRTTYAEAAPGEPLLYLDSYGRLALAVNLDSAARRYGLTPGRRLRVRRP
jgi:S-adenosylmethionine hydrolase